jgi:hypothetical protein
MSALPAILPHFAGYETAGTQQEAPIGRNPGETEASNCSRDMHLRQSAAHSPFKKPVPRLLLAQRVCGPKSSTPLGDQTHLPVREGALPGPGQERQPAVRGLCTSQSVPGARQAPAGAPGTLPLQYDNRVKGQAWPKSADRGQSHLRQLAHSATAHDWSGFPKPTIAGG